MTTERTRKLASLLSLFLVSCGSPSTQASTVYVDTNRVPAELRDDYASFSVNCSKCHSLARAFNAHVTETAHWDLYVARMVRTAGSSISKDEVPGILRFLYWYTESYDRHASFTQKTSEEAPQVAAPLEQSEEAAQPAPVEEAPPAPVVVEPPPAPAPSDAPLGAPPTEKAPAPDTQNTAGEGQ